jgi:segregation and condensation protein B
MSIEPPEPENSDLESVDSHPTPAPSEPNVETSGDLEGDEISLDRLSRVYAQALQKRQQESSNDSQAQAGAADQDTFEMQTTSDGRDAIERIMQVQSIGNSSESDHDVFDDQPCRISPESILEAILFVGAPNGVKLTARTIASAIRDVSPKEIKQLVTQLNNKYEQTHAVYRIIDEDGGLRLKIMEEWTFVHQHMLGRNRRVNLSQGAIDVLAVVAYNQPLSREQIDKIRSKSSGSLLKQLVLRELLEVEITESAPRKRLFRTTERFLDLFGLESLDDLPQTDPATDLKELSDL